MASTSAKPATSPRPAVGVPSLPRGFRSRSRLLDALDVGGPSALTLVSAPAGFGKTSLLADWLGSRVTGGAAWVTCRRDEPEAVWRELLERLAEAAPDTPLARLQPAPDGGNEHVGMLLVEHARSLEEPVTLVLDDVHELQDQALLRTLARLVRGRRTALRLVLATRADPALPLARLRLEDGLTEVRAANLAFDVDEVRALVADGPWAVSDVAARLLIARTEGWPAGVRLVLLSLRGVADADEFIRTLAGDDHAIATYLFEEVLDDQPAEMRRFLLEASVLDRFDAALAERTTGNLAAGRLLAHLARNNVFLEAVDAHGTAFRFHPLFRDLLRNEARQEIAERLPALHSRAARWFAARDAPLEAMRHGHAAGEWPFVADVLVCDAMRLVVEGHAELVLDALRSLPDEVSADPELLSTAAMVAAEAGDREHVERCLERLAVLTPGVPLPRRARFELARAIAELSLLGTGSGLAAVREASEAVLAALEALPEHLPHAERHRAVALLRLGIAESSMVPEEVAGAEHLGAALEAARALGDPHLVVVASAELALRDARALDLVRAQAAAAAALEVADPAGWSASAAALPAHLALAITGLETGDRVAAAAALAASAPALRRAGTDPRLTALHRLLATVLDAAAPAERSAAHRALARDTTLPRAEREAAAWLAATLGGADAQAPPAPAEPSALGRRWELLRARRLAGRGELTGAAVALEGLLAAAPPDRWPYARADALVLAALVAEGLRAPVDVDDRLEEALAITAETGAVRAFVDGGRSVQALLKAHVRTQTAHRRVLSDVLERFSQAARPAPVTLLEPLTPRELSILRFLGTELSGEDIASELFISLNTVKTHLRAIYRKLDASSRRQAVANARQLGLLAPRRGG